MTASHPTFSSMTRHAPPAPWLSAIGEKFATGHLQDQYFRVSGQALVSDTPQHPPYRYRTPECPIRGLGRGMISHEQWAREAAAAPTVMGTPPLPRRHGHSSLSLPCRHGHSPSPALPSWALTCPRGPPAHEGHATRPRGPPTYEHLRQTRTRMTSPTTRPTCPRTPTRTPPTMSPSSRHA